MKEIIIKSLNELISQYKTEKEVQSIFRGQSDIKYKLESGLFRLMRKYYNKKKISEVEHDTYIPQAIHIFTENLIESAKKTKYSHKVLQKLNDIDILVELQHYGAATPLLDFSYNMLVALYFTCLSDCSKDSDCEGVLYQFNIVNSEDLSGCSDSIDKLWKRLDVLKKDNKLGFIRPLNYNYRILKQDSVLVFLPNGYIADDDDRIDKKFVIPSDKKNSILKELKQGMNICSETLFPDFYGFASENSNKSVNSHLLAKLTPLEIKAASFCDLLNTHKIEEARKVLTTLKELGIEQEKYEKFVNLLMSYERIEELAVKAEAFKN